MVLESQRIEIEKALLNIIDIKLTFATIPDSEDWGTADSLRYIKDMIKVTVVLYSEKVCFLMMHCEK